MFGRRRRSRGGYGGGGFWREYVPVATRHRRAAEKVKKLRKGGMEISPVTVEGRTIATTFWGASWCSNLERYSDFANRLPRGRTYVRNGSVVHLGVTPGRVEALVSGSEMYNVLVEIAPLAAAAWKAIRKDCTGSIDSLVELLQGRLSKGVMERVSVPGKGLFPTPKEIRIACSCPDFAILCKHAAAVLYGIGARMDRSPELLFMLRGVDPLDLVAGAAGGMTGAGANPAGEGLLEDADLAGVFGIDIEGAAPASSTGMEGTEPSARKPARRKAKRGAPSPAVKKPAGKTAAKPRGKAGTKAAAGAKSKGKPKGQRPAAASKPTAAKKPRSPKKPSGAAPGGRKTTRKRKDGSQES